MPQVGAVKGGHLGCIRLLLNHGASLVSCPKVILADCVESIVEGVPALLSRYLAAGADPNLADANGCTLLHIAAAEKRLLAVKMLVQAGANVLAEDRFGLTPIDTATRFKANNVVLFLQPAVNKALATSRVKNRANDNIQMTIADMDELENNVSEADVREAAGLSVAEGEKQVNQGWVKESSAWNPLALPPVAPQDPTSTLGRPSRTPPDNSNTSLTPRGPAMLALGAQATAVSPIMASDRPLTSSSGTTRATSVAERNGTPVESVRAATFLLDIQSFTAPTAQPPAADKGVSVNSSAAKETKYVEGSEAVQEFAQENVRASTNAWISEVERELGQ